MPAYGHAGSDERREEDQVLDSVWSAAALAALSLVTAVVFAAAAARRSGDRSVPAAHALMGVAMAAMFSPWGDPVPPVAGAVVFALVAAWFAAVRLNQGRSGMDVATHTAIAAAAMVVMYLWHQPGGEPAAGGGSGHAHHGGGASGSAGVLVVVASLLLGAYFVWHAWMCAREVEDATPDTPPDTEVRVRRRTRVEPAAHLLMSALMAVMFLGAL
jgi:hypothetical protein